MNPLFWVDARLITNVVEPIAWRIQYRWDKDNFYLAEKINDMASAAFVVADILMAIHLRDPFWVLIGSWIAWGLRSTFQETIWKCAKRVRNTPRAPNPQKTPQGQLIRILGFWLVIPLMALASSLTDRNIITWIFLSVFATGHFIMAYLTGCNPMPPMWQKPKRKAPHALQAS